MTHNYPAPMVRWGWIVDPGARIRIKIGQNAVNIKKLLETI